MLRKSVAATRNRARQGAFQQCDYGRGRGVTMNWVRIPGNWKQMTGKVKEQWGKLTDDDLAQVNGNREQLEGKIQARYGDGKDQAKKEIDDWLGRT
jgi:uncharacterized protein YjbJ (UPF0337 family)